MVVEGLLTNCRVCGSPNISFICSTFNEHSQTSQLENFRCLECDSVFVANAIEPAELGVAYSTLDPETYYRETKSEAEAKFRSALMDLKALVPFRAAIIDIGAGDGAFAEALLDTGFSNVSVHEIGGASFPRLSGRLQAVYSDFDYGEIPSASFDVVTMLDVAEHVRNPQFLFDQCARILKPGGLVYFHTPVVTRLDRAMHLTRMVPGLRKLGSIWQRGRTSIFHLENYTRKSLAIVAQRSGLVVESLLLRNELSWPVHRYVRVYLVEKCHLPRFLGPPFALLLYPVLATTLFNANKAIVSERKPS